MTVYPDASVLVAAIVREPCTEKAQALLASEADVVVSEWILTEAASALAIKQRTGALTREQRLIAHAAAEAVIDAAASLSVLPRHFRAATRLIERSALPLRGGDALHLAISADHGATLWTLDRKLVAAGQALAFDVRLLA